MDDSLISVIVGVTMHFLLAALPFLAFGIAIFNKFRRTSLIFIIYAMMMTVSRLASEFRELYIHKMHEAGMPTSDIAMSWQVLLPKALNFSCMALIIAALISLAIAIDRKLGQPNNAINKP